MNLNIPTALAIEELEKRYPREWAILYPRVYERTSSYHTPKHIAADLLAAFIAEEQAKQNNYVLGAPDQHASIGASLLVSLNVPTFFLSRTLLDAVAQTRPPQAIEWPEMHLPFEAAAFIFPRGTLKHKTEGELSCLWYARLRGSQIYRHPFAPGRTFEVGEDKLYFRGLLDKSLGSLMHGYSVSLQPTISAVDLSRSSDDTFYGQSTKPLDESDQTILQSAISLVLGVLLVMLERPQLVSHGSFTGKRSKRGLEFWTPNVVGGNYRVVADTSSKQELGNSPRLHWRRGHWREQAYGAGFKLRKLLWIEPTLVSAGNAIPAVNGEI